MSSTNAPENSLRNQKVIPSRRVLKFENRRCGNSYRIRCYADGRFEIYFNDWHRHDNDSEFGSSFRHISYIDKVTYGISGNAKSFSEAVDLATMHAKKLLILEYLPTETTFRDSIPIAKGSNSTLSSWGPQIAGAIGGICGAAV